MSDTTLTDLIAAVTGDLDLDTTLATTHRPGTAYAPPTVTLSAHGLTFEVTHTGNLHDGRPLLAWDLIDGQTHPVVGSQATVLTGSVAADLATLIACARHDFWPADADDDALETVNVTPGQVAAWIGAR